MFLQELTLQNAFKTPICHICVYICIKYALVDYMNMKMHLFSPHSWQFFTGARYGCKSTDIVYCKNILFTLKSVYCASSLKRKTTELMPRYKLSQRR